MEKEYYSIGEVSKLTAIPAYTLRYWEKENLIKSVRSGNSQRKYKADDIGLIQKIKDMLYIQKLTIEGAKKLVNRARASGETLHLNLGGQPAESGKAQEFSQEIRTTIKDTINLIDRILKDSIE